ncbi:unnamed protein product [Trifolium pratense]|uniref:Uncharacterized protein n=1 Tax=Trifolium pratense TaxID=57577 RepID=A0ACB0KF54_TRIPR|nr:unnamed protein product [Trifolium pratense]
MCNSLLVAVRCWLQWEACAEAHTLAGAHTAKEPVRPLRRALQDLDPRTTPSMFINARCIGEEKINEEDCFILNLCADPLTLKARSEEGDVVYWETTINSFLYDYKPVKGIMIAHSGQSVVTLFRFGETAMSHTKTRMEEAWTIEELAFNVPGLSIDCFIPPSELRFASISEASELSAFHKVRG